MSVNVKPTLSYRGIGGLRVKDWMILNILYANQWRKPIYFAVTVSDDNKVNLQDYMRMDGLAFKVIPFKDVEISPTRLQKNLFEVYQYRRLDDPKVYYDDNVQGLLQNYRSAFLRLASYYQRVNHPQAMLAALDKMEAAIPEKVIPIKDPRIIAWIGQMYYLGGRSEELEKRLDEIVTRGDVAWQNKLQYATWYTQYLRKPDKAEKVMRDVKQKYPDQMQPYAYLVNLYEEQRQYPKGIEVLQDWLRRNPGDENARARLEQLKQSLTASDSAPGTVKTPPGHRQVQRHLLPDGPGRRRVDDATPGKHHHPASGR